MSSYAIEVFNFKAGVVCNLEVYSERAEVGVPIEWICDETETIYVTGQGSCTYNHEEKRCSWYGFEFDYSGASDQKEVLCMTTSGLPANIGNPTEEIERDVTVDKWSFSLPSGDGHFFNPQYSTFAPKDVEVVDTQETVCTFEDKELFRYRFIMITPLLPEKAVKHSLERLRLYFEGKKKSKPRG